MSTTVLSLTQTPPMLMRSMPRRSVAPAVISKPRCISSHSLLDGARELVIQHQGGEYHLRLTRNDKLILTK